MLKKMIRTSLRVAIKKKYGSVNSFCKAHEINQSDLNRFLVGKKDFTLSKLVKICDCLELQLVVLDKSLRYKLID
jgi:DNA-binding Xre family transcriptional regulator